MVSDSNIYGTLMRGKYSHDYPDDAMNMDEME